MRNKEHLKKNLQQATALYLLYKSNDFQNYLVPYLKQLSTVEHIDPKKFATREEYYFALDNANQEARVYAQFLLFMERQEGAMKAFTAEIKKEDLNYSYESTTTPTKRSV